MNYRFLKLLTIPVIFFTNTVIADDFCKDYEPFKFLTTEIVVEDFKFNFVRLSDSNERGDWQDPDCYDSQLFIQDKQLPFDIYNLPYMERTATLIETMKSRKFSLSVITSDQKSYVVVEGNYGGNQSAFFNLYQIQAGVLTRLAREDYTGELTAWNNNGNLEVKFMAYDHNSPAAKSSADTPVIEITKSYKNP